AEQSVDGFLRWSLDWFSPGRAGVCAFFLVSGYVIPISLERDGDLRRFAVGRVSRLYPLYWASLGAALLLDRAGVPALPTDFDLRLPASAWVNLTMGQELVGVPHAIGVYYTLTIELVWYLGCAVLFALGWLAATERLATLALGGLALVGVGVPLVLDRHVPFSTGFYLVTMLLGTALARRDAGTLDPRRFRLLLATAAAIGAAGCWANYVHAPGGADPDGPLGLTSAFVPWVAGYAAVLVLHRYRHLRFPRVATWLGVVSYGVYLLHPLVLAVLRHRGAGPAVAILGTLAGSAVVAGIAHRLVEVPGQALGRRLRAWLPIRA
ncbi:MAG TPA: acyltransferase, partial [Acidimicrobiales bacterium]|nr:acyltransferase [Acidimicrobiales bacterium]